MRAVIATSKTADGMLVYLQAVVCPCSSVQRRASLAISCDVTIFLNEPLRPYVAVDRRQEPMGGSYCSLQCFREYGYAAKIRAASMREPKET